MNGSFLAHPEVLNRLHDSVIATSLDGTITDCNAAAEKIYEYPREELIGSNVVRLYRPNHLPLMRELMAAVVANSRADGEFPNLTKTGREIWIHLSVSLLKEDGGAAYGMIAFSIDITAQKHAEQARREAEEWNRDARVAAGLGIWLWNLKTGELNWDKQSAVLLGVGDGAQSGYELFLSCVHPEDCDRLRQALQHSIDQGGSYAEEFRVVHPDGSIRWLAGRGRTYRGENGIPERMLGVVSDITQQHQALAALQAGEVLASAAKMASALAHEINNPLASLTNILYLMRFGNSRMSKDDLLLAAQEALDRVGLISRQMIGLYGESGKTSEFNLAELLEDTLAAYAARARAKNIRIHQRNLLPDATLKAVESDFRRLFSALIENAVEYTQPGGMLRVRLSPGQDWKRRSRRGIRIVVSDNGPGIPRENLPHLFAPFYSTKTKPASGLGLWVSREVVEKYEGAIRVRSSTRRGVSGTCVSVFLPGPLAPHDPKMTNPTAPPLRNTG